MSWLEKLLPPKIQPNERGERRTVPEGLWIKCPSCETVLYKTDLEQNLYVCPKCSHHHRIGARARLDAFLDPEGRYEIGQEVLPVDALKFKDSKKYTERLKDALENTGETDALIVMGGAVHSVPIVVACFEFEFMGGSMGSVVGERFVRGVESAIEQKTPFVSFTATGGARMQEGLLSLMQMAKTNAARTHRLCRPARDREHRAREAARRLPARRVPVADRRGRHHRRPARTARSHRARHCHAATPERRRRQLRAVSTQLPTTLAEWLAHCERIHPTEIDMTLDRVVAVKARLGLTFETLLIAVAGTNGKGSTCAMLEAIALQAGYRVGLYSKPHLVHFEERCRVNGQMVSPTELLPHFEAVEQARGDISLTYFEFTTLAIARLLSKAPLDLAILEVGLGARLDAVNAFDADCSIITSIDIDHVGYLGPDRESIGREKAHIMRRGKPAIVSDPAPPQSVLDHADRIGADLWLVGRDFNCSGDKLQWAWAGRSKRFNALGYPALRGANQLINASGVLAAFEALRESLPITAQAVRTGLAMVELPGRFQIVAGRPTLVLDVAHNPHAVAALTQSLDQMGFFPRTHAVFGAMHDKDIAGILARIAPLVDHWHFTDLPVGRAASAADLAQLHARLALKGPGPVTVEQHANPLQAFAAALEAADPADRIVVFGSFQTVGGVLKNGVPRLTGKHTA